jgi:DUF438 domain-containing protein
MSEHIDNSARRKAMLKALIRQLHEGKSVEDVKAEFAKLLQDVGAGEIAEIEQALIAEGLPEMEVKRLCDVHVAVFRESLDAQVAPEEQPGHPVHTFRAENEAAEAVLGELGRAMEETDWSRAHKLLDILREYEVHYLRKENILFPYLEQHGFSGPSSVMWAIHDDIRARWKMLDRLLSENAGNDPTVNDVQVKATFASVAKAMREMFYKEENILFPASLERLTDEEWLAAREQEPELGYAYIQPGDQWPPTESAAERASAPISAAQAGEAGTTGLLSLDTGALTEEQVRLMLSHLPLDITFVDAEDRVRFFSHGEERIFPRSAAVIGREVQKCHPPHSVHRVQRILDDFREGSRDVAEFWIQMGPPQAEGRFVHIRYFAVRDERGAYQGTLEVAQDLTPLRALEGERRLLDEKE